MSTSQTPTLREKVARMLLERSGEPYAYKPWLIKKHEPLADAILATFREHIEAERERLVEAVIPRDADDWYFMRAGAATMLDILITSELLGTGEK